MPTRRLKMQVAVDRTVELAATATTRSAAQAAPTLTGVVPVDLAAVAATRTRAQAASEVYRGLAAAGVTRGAGGAAAEVYRYLQAVGVTSSEGQAAPEVLRSIAATAGTSSEGQAAAEALRAIAATAATLSEGQAAAAVEIGVTSIADIEAQAISDGVTPILATVFDDVVLNGSFVAQVNNEFSGGGKLADQSNAAFQPAYLATGGPNGTPCSQGTGVSEYLGNVTDTWVAADTDFFVYVVCLSDSIVNNTAVIQAYPMLLQQRAVGTGRYRCREEAVPNFLDNPTETAIAWSKVRMVREDDTTISFRIGATETTAALGAASEGLSPVGIHGKGGGGFESPSRVALFMAFQGLPTTALDALINTFITERFGLP